MPNATSQMKVVENALSVAGVSADPAFVAQMTSVLKSSAQLYEQHKDSDLMKGAIFGAQQMSRTGRFLKTVGEGTNKAPLLLNMSPNRAVVAVLAVMSEKVAFSAGLASDNERVKCGAAIAALAGNTAAMLILGAGTGGLTIGLTVLSLGSSLMSVNRECKFLNEDGAKGTPSSPSLKLH